MDTVFAVHAGSRGFDFHSVLWPEKYGIRVAVGDCSVTECRPWRPPYQTGKTLQCAAGWSGGAMVLGKLPVPGRPTILITVGQGPIALAVGAGGGGLDIFTLTYPFSSFSLSLGDGLI